MECSRTPSPETDTQSTITTTIPPYTSRRDDPGRESPVPDSTKRSIISPSTPASTPSSPAEPPQQQLRSVPSMTLSVTSPTRVIPGRARQLEMDLSSVAWTDLDGVSWVTNFRAALKSVVYGFCVQLSLFLTLYEGLGKTEFKRYKFIDGTLRELWAQWVNFAAAKQVGNEELEASPVNWAFEAAISNIISVKGATAAHKAKMSDIRFQCRKLGLEMVYLKGLLEESSIRALEGWQDEQLPLVKAGLSYSLSDEVIERLAQTSTEINLSDAGAVLHEHERVKEVFYPLSDEEIDRQIQTSAEIILSHQGTILDGLDTKDENWRDIRSMLPGALRHAVFTGRVWSIRHPLPKSVPLRIARKPVVVMPRFMKRPGPWISCTAIPDPLTETKLDPLSWIEDEMIIRIRRALPPTAYYLLFLTNGTLVILVSQKLTSAQLNLYPRQIGGQWVIYSDNGALLPTSTHGGATSSKGQVEGRLASVVPGEELYWKGPDYQPGKIPTGKTSTQLQGCAAGLVVNFPNRGSCLTTTTHGYSIPNANVAKEHSLFSLYTPREGEMVYSRNLENVGKVIFSYDPEVRGEHKFSDKYIYDLSLLGQPPKMVYDRDLSFFRPKEVPFDADLRLLTPRPLSINAKGVPFGWGTVVGQGFALNSGRKSPQSGTEEHTSTLVQRALLWRNCGPLVSLVGFSGCPLEIIDHSPEAVEDGAGRVCGFQNFELLDADVQFLDDNQPTQAEELYSNEEIVKRRVEVGRHSIYGSLRLPDEMYGGGVTIEVARS